MPKLQDIVLLMIRGFLWKKAVTQARKKGVLVYLKTLQAVRRGLAGGLLAIVFLQLMIFGLIGSFVTGVLLVPTEIDTKLWILFTVFSVLFFIPMLILSIVFSEKIWYEQSGAKKMLSDLENQ